MEPKDNNTINKKHKDDDITFSFWERLGCFGFFLFIVLSIIPFFLALLEELFDLDFNLWSIGIYFAVPAGIILLILLIPVLVKDVKKSWHNKENDIIIKRNKSKKSKIKKTKVRQAQEAGMLSIASDPDEHEGALSFNDEEGKLSVDEE